MNRKHLMVVAAAAFTVALVGCSDSGSTGTGGGSGGGGGSKFCTSTSCASGEICHPTAKLCVKKCSAAADCSGGDTTCGVPVGGSTTTVGDAGLVQSCNCTSTSACGNATSGNVCQDFDKICTAKCTKNDDCPNSRTCDTTSGMCLGASGSDAGMDAGIDAGPACTWGSCTGGKVCQFVTGVCETPKSCVTTDGGQGGCDYGHYCNAGTCAEVTKPANCANFNPDAGGKPAVWNGKSTNGPIIYGLTALAGDNNALAGTDFCGATNQTYTVQLKAYNANSTFPADNMAAQLGNLKYVREDGNECDAVSCNGGPIFRLQSGYTVSPNLKDVTIKISLCSTGGASPASINGGFYFTGGNEACTNIPN